MREPVEERDLILATVRTFVDREVAPAASALEHRNEYPAALVERMQEIGLFGINVPEAYGGTALGAVLYAEIFEELARGWMSVAGVLGTHLVICDVIAHHGTDEQKRRYLPLLASGSIRGALALTEAHAGSDLKAIATTATRDGADYVLDGSKMWITNARRGGIFVVLAKTGPAVLSAFIVEKGEGVEVTRDIEKLGKRASRRASCGSMGAGCRPRT